MISIALGSVHTTTTWTKRRTYPAWTSSCEKSWRLRSVDVSAAKIKYSWIDADGAVEVQSKDTVWVEAFDKRTWRLQKVDVDEVDDKLLVCEIWVTEGCSFEFLPSKVRESRRRRKADLAQSAEKGKADFAQSAETHHCRKAYLAESAEKGHPAECSAASGQYVFLRDPAATPDE